MMILMMRTMTKNKMSVFSKISNTAKRNNNTVTKAIITAPNTYKPGAAYSQAILANQTLYVSGVLGMDSKYKLACGVEAQTKLLFENMKQVLKAGGASLESVIKTTILLAKMEDFPVVNKIYACYFPKNSPARATFQVVNLPRGAAIEIEAIALSGELVITQGLPADPCSNPCS
ncbi:unnamed protein product [Chrysodeixis includens]|uniref:Uncharacterized protein n=1 Tax=Chrysodeixis includens TaxID=689277 RepID=A0A9P0BNP9_CHRIL|nr:unnamed protein product [Chrysodeixis includens]